MNLKKTKGPSTEDVPLQDEALYGMLFANSLDGLMLTTPDGMILDANPAACQIFGLTRDEILRAGRYGLIDASDPRLPPLIAERERTGRAYGELIARRKDGSLFPLEFSSVVFKSTTGEARTCLIIRDITERKSTEAERERLIQDLQDALGRVKSLSGLLPMCASCRKIRDQQGAWHDLETYIRSHTGTDFSHGICPDCRQELYPETVRG